MAEPTATPVASHLAERLRARSDDLIEQWIEWLTTGVTIHSARVLPREAIIDHLPHVIRGIAEFLVRPVDAVKRDLAEDLRAHARTRRKQGYDIEELTLEYQGLNRIVSDAMVEALHEYAGELDPVRVAEVFIRLLDGLGEIVAVTVSTYRQQELEYSHTRRREIVSFSRMLAHEIKNPLQAVSAAASMLEDGTAFESDEDRGRFLALIKRGVKRIQDLSDEILILARGENLPGDEEPVRLRDLVEGVIDELRPSAEEKGVRVSIDEPLPEISVGSARAQLALVNLVSNGIKYADPDKSDRWVRIGAKPLDSNDPPTWDVYVADNGLGIPEHLEGKVMQRHFRAHPDVAEGTGLGLAIAREAIEQRGGRIWFETRENEGSIFHFSIRESERPAGDSDRAARQADAHSLAAADDR